MSRDWYIVTPVVMVAFFAMQAALYRRTKQQGLALMLAVFAVAQAFFGFEMHYGGRSWHDLILGPCSRTEYHRRAP